MAQTSEERESKKILNEDVIDLWIPRDMFQLQKENFTPNLCHNYISYKKQGRFCL